MSVWYGRFPDAASVQVTDSGISINEPCYRLPLAARLPGLCSRLHASTSTHDTLYEACTLTGLFARALHCFPAATITTLCCWRPTEAAVASALACLTNSCGTTTNRTAIDLHWGCQEATALCTHR